MKKSIGSIAWTDLTVRNAQAIRDFYADVIGWQPEPFSMGEYADYTMADPETGEPVAGICHSRGVNADLPPQWLIYVVVEDVDQAAERCVQFGGTVLRGPTSMGPASRYCVIQDPSGAVCALYSES